MEEPRIPIAKEGWPFILAPALLAEILALGGLIGWALLAFAATCLAAYFFRDPPRFFAGEEGEIVAPADGRIVFLGQTEKGPLGEEAAIKVSIFMNLFDVHVNRVPATGRVVEMRYYPGQFFNASLDKASSRNERLALALQTETGQRLNVVQVAGLIARRIVCYARPGDELKAGQRFGLIRFGSRLDLYLPLASQLYVSLGQRVLAGQTPLGRLP